MYLVESIVVIILILFYLFFFPRLLGYIVGFFLRFLLWKKYNAYFEFEALQVSPLGGRILFKDAIYCSRNQGFKVLKGGLRLWEEDPKAWV